MTHVRGECKEESKCIEMPAFERLITSINKNIFIWHKQLHESWAKFYARLKSLYFSQILLLNVFLTIQHHPRLTPSISNNYTFPIIKYYSQVLTNLKLQWTCSLYNLSVVSNVIFLYFHKVKILGDAFFLVWGKSHKLFTHTLLTLRRSMLERNQTTISLPS